MPNPWMISNVDLKRGGSGLDCLADHASGGGASGSRFGEDGCSYGCETGGYLTAMTVMAWVTRRTGSVNAMDRDSTGTEWPVIRVTSKSNLQSWHVKPTTAHQPKLRGTICEPLKRTSLNKQNE